MSAIESADGLARYHPQQFLKNLVFEGLRVDEFQFGSGGGHLGLNMISQYIVVPSHTLPGGLQPTSDSNMLAIHLNSIVKASALQGDTMTIHVEMFHITARTLAAQKKIDAHGPSSITASESIHININTTWGQAENLKALANEVGVAEDGTLYFELNKKEGFNNAYVGILGKMFRQSVEQRIQHLLGGHVTVKWVGDKSFQMEY